jgi:hypothetical protein
MSDKCAKTTSRHKTVPPYQLQSSSPFPPSQIERKSVVKLCDGIQYAFVRMSSAKEIHSNDSYFVYTVTAVRELIFINLKIAKKKNQEYRKSIETPSINYV